MKSSEMIKLEYFTNDEFDLLIRWINNESLLQNWTGSMFSFPLTHEKLEWYISDTNDKDKSDALVYKAVDMENGKLLATFL